MVNQYGHNMPFDWKGFYLYRFRLPKIGELPPQATEGLFYSCPEIM